MDSPGKLPFFSLHSNIARAVLFLVLIAAVGCSDRGRSIGKEVRGGKGAMQEPMVTLPERQGAAVEWAAQRVSDIMRSMRDLPAAAPIRVERVAKGNLPAESFSISRHGEELVVCAGDRAGETYGLLELADRCQCMPPGQKWSEFLNGFANMTRTPYVKFRADNPFVHINRNGLESFEEKIRLKSPPRLFADMAMWEAYIDMLAQSRFNVMDLHGIYNEATTGFYNLLPLLVSVPEYPRVGSHKIQRANRKDLRHLLAYARDRGVSVALMNYSSRVDGLPESKRRDYTRKAVRLLLERLPGLHQFGFRIGESGEKSDFYEETYVAGLRDSGRSDVRLYTRSWKTTRPELEKLAAKVDGRLTVEIKYNGEHLGLPYQAIQGPRNSGYSYVDIASRGEPYDILWQVRANGTMRFWTWADSAFIRRAVGSFGFGGAKGFSLEPESAYFSTETASFLKRPEDRAVYRYTWQQNWPWYAAWGRLAFQPDLPDEAFTGLYRSHFGAGGAEVYQALQASGAIVPMALAYRFTGPDQRNMSPETQSGAFDTANNAPLTPLSFAENSPMDGRSFVGIHEFVEGKVAGRIESRVGPFAIAGLMSRQAVKTRAAVAAADRDLQANGEWRLLKADLMATSYLGDYYAARILGTMHLDYALATGSAHDYDLAMKQLEGSREAWSELARTLDPIRKPIENPLIGQHHFTWGSELQRLTQLDETIPALWKKRGAVAGALPLVFTSSEKGEPLPVAIASVDAEVIPEKGVRITCLATPDAEVRKLTVWSKGFPSDGKWIAAPMAKDGSGKFSVTVPLHPEGVLYMIAAEDTSGGAAQFPSPLEATPFWVAGR